MAEHKAVIEEVLPMDCIYGECEHDGNDCPPVKMEVCGTCRAPWEDDEDYELFMPWPCAPSLESDGSGS